ncbi:MAG: hypothetical protein OEM52_00330 [bacterium]|nr:hypothetical protein [bacterium]
MITSFFFCVTSGIAQPRLAFQAELESGYRTTQNLNDPSSGSKGSEFLHNYGFGLRGYILSPNFISYRAGMRLHQSNRKYGDTWTITRTLDLIDLNTHVFQNRPLSFKFNYRRTQSDFTYGRQTDRKYDNFAGADILYQNPILPSIQLSYLYNSTESDKYGTAGSHISSIRLQRYTDLATVSAFFLDEQRRDLIGGRFARHQQIQLDGQANLFDRTTTLTSNFEYAGYNNNYRSTRFGTRVLSMPNPKNRVLAQYGFNTTQSIGSSTYSNVLQADYKRFFTPELTGTVRGSLFRQMQLTKTTEEEFVNRSVSAGSEYISVKLHNDKTMRTIANGFFDYDKSSTTDDRVVFRSVGAYQIQQRFTTKFAWSNMYTLSGRVSRTRQLNDYNVNHTFENQMSFTPIRVVLLQNMITLKDQEGRRFTRGFENRSNLALLFSHGFSVRTGLITNVTVQPDYRRVDYWTSNLGYEITRNLVWSAQSSYTLDRQVDVEFGKVESSLRYQLNELALSLQAEESISQDRKDLTLFVNASRKIGGGLAR